MPAQLKQQPATLPAQVLQPPAPQVDSIIPQSPGTLNVPQLQAVMPPPQKPAFNPDTDLRDFGDALATRRNIYESVFEAASKMPAMEDDKFQLKLTNLQWADPERFSRKDRKKAILTGETLGRRLRGTWELYDKISGKLVEARPQVVARVPYMSSLGTFTNKGNEYTLNNQQRLRSGTFTRIQDNGELEAHANILPGKGVSHRYRLDPAKGVFKIKIGQSEMPLMPLLRAMGTTDKEFVENWGRDLYAANYKADDSTVLRKLRAKLLSRADQTDEDESSVRKKLIAAFERMEMDEEVTKRTLGQPFKNVNKDSILATTKKLLAVSRGEADVDDRDHLAYQTFYGPEDLFRERIERDHGNVRKQIFRKISQTGSLKAMPTGLFTPQLEQAILGSGLGQALEEINPAEVFDKLTRITRMGEGGIPSLEAIPDEARGVQPSHMGFMDPVRTPESFRVGVDVHLARGARKGKDGRIYTQLRDNKTGETVWKTPQDMAEAAIATPDAMNWDTKRVPVMKAGKITYVPKDEIDYVLPDFERAFSPLANLVPLKSGVKPGRLAMGSRYITQALPLSKPEAPLVQGALPDMPDKSFEDEYGKQMGAVRADKGGRVLDVKDGVVKVQYEDGTTDDIEMYENYPFNRKTYIHQTPMVKPGDSFTPGQLLAKSNFTDDTGATALGINMRTAYIPWRGYNFKDAVVISESAAKRLSSEHMYQHDVEVTEKHKVGKKSYASLFPQKFDRETLDKLDDKGVIQVGQTVEYGQPLILAAREQDRAHNKIHKKRQPGHVDETVLWKHHDPGVVTDVVWGKKGAVVLVKSAASMQVGDKISGRYGDKGVVAAIVPDKQMPHGADGNPFEILLSPLGIISRTNPTQKIEAWLGKIARKTGKPVKVPDFSSVDDLVEWTHKELQKHGLSDTEDVIDPHKGRKVGGVATGDRFFMKLHHTAETKGQGRGSGGYTMEDAPAKGGEQGCFTGDTLVETVKSDGGFGLMPIKHAALRYRQAVRCKNPENAFEVRGEVTDLFHYRVPAQELIEVELENGEILKVTRNHEFYLKDGTKKLAGDLAPGDDLLE